MIKDLQTLGERNNSKNTIHATKWLSHLQTLIGTETKVSTEQKTKIEFELNSKKTCHVDFDPMLESKISDKEIKDACLHQKNIFKKLVKME